MAATNLNLPLEKHPGERFLPESAFPIDLGVDVRGVRIRLRPCDIGYEIRHLCKTGADDDLINAPRVDTTTGKRHRVSVEGPMLTIEGSILCKGCGLHGFVRNRKWVPA